MRFCILTCLFFIQSVLVAQTGFVYDTCKVLEGFTLSQRMKEDLICSNQGETVQLLFHDKKNKPLLHTFNEQTPLKGKTLTIKAKGYDKNTLRKVLGFATQGQDLAISHWEGIHIFQEKGNSYVFRSSIEKRNATPYIHLRDSFIYMGFFYNYHPKDNKDKFFIQKLRFDGTVVDSVKFHVFYPELLLYGPKSLITFGKNHIYAVQPAPFRIYRISYDFRHIDSMNITTPYQWKIMSAEHHAQFETRLPKYDKLLDSIAYRSINRIEEIHVVRDTLLLVRELYFDDTVRLSKSVGCTQKRLYVISMTSGKTLASYPEAPCKGGTAIINKNTFPIRSNLGHLIYYTHGLMLEFRYASPHTPLNSTYTDFYYRNEEWLKKNKPVLNMWIYKYNF